MSPLPPVKCLGQALFRVEALAALVERHLREVGAEPHLAGIGHQRAGQQVEQRRLAGAVRADDADPVAAHDPRRKIPHDRAAAIGFGDALRHGDQPAGQIGLRRLEPDRALRAALLLALPAQRVQFGEPPLVAGAPGGDAIAQPILLHRDLAAELVLFVLLLFEDRVAPRLERRETLVQRPGDAAVEPDRGAREAFEQPSVVADQDDAGAHPGQLALQPLDAGQIEMIGRLVEQQDVGRGSQRAGQRGAARLAAGKRAGSSSPERPSSLSRYSARWRPSAVRGAKTRLDIGQRGGEPGQIGFLRQIVDRRAGLGEALSGIGLDEPGGDAQQGRFARAVAPDEADPVAGRDGQPRAGKQRRHPEGEADVLQQKQTAAASPTKYHGSSLPLG